MGSWCLPSPALMNLMLWWRYFSKIPSSGGGRARMFFLLDLDAEWQWVNLNLGIWKQDIWFYNLFLKLIVMMASSYISLPQSTKGWKFEDVIKSNDDVAEAICRNESYCPMSQMSQSPCLCWRHVEEAKQIATKYSTDPKAPMNLGKIGCIGIGVAFFCALHWALIHASIFNRFGSMIPATRTHNEMHQYGRKWGKESQSIIDGIYPPAEWYWDTRRPWRRFWRRVLHIPWRKSNVWWRFWRGRCTREVWTTTPRYNVEILLFGSFACYESLFLGIIVSLCHLNIQESPETVTLKWCK